MSILVEISLTFKPWLAAAKEDTRPILTGVFIDPSGYAVATDTHGMVVCPVKIEGDTVGWKGCLIPAAALEEAAKAVKKWASVLAFSIDTSDHLHNVTLPGKHGPFTVEEIVGTFPAWRNIVESRVDDLAGTPSTGRMVLNPFLFARVAQALGYDPKGVSVVPHDWGKGNRWGYGPVLVYGEEKSFGVVMPGASEVSERVKRSDLFSPFLEAKKKAA